MTYRTEEQEEAYRKKLLPCGYSRSEIRAGRILGVLLVAGLITVIYLIHTHVGPATPVNPS